MHWNIIYLVQIIDRANITARYVQGHHGDKKASMAGHTYNPQDKRIVRTCTLAKPKKKKRYESNLHHMPTSITRGTKETGPTEQ